MQKCVFAGLLAAAALLALASPAAAHCNYLIDRTETLSSIAEGYEITIQDIAALNPQIEDINLIFEGDVIRLPCEVLEKENSVEELLGHRNDTFYVYTAIQKAGLAEALLDEDLKVTVFAPTDEAFEAYLAEKNVNLTQVFAEGNLAALADLLTYHVVTDGALKAKDLENGQVLETMLEGQTLKFVAGPAGASVQTSSNQTVAIVATDLIGGKSVIHLVDEVLVPGAKKPTPGPCTYAIKAGDDLTKIAEQFSTTVDKLVELNDLENADEIVAGDTLVLRANCEETRKLMRKLML